MQDQEGAVGVDVVLIRIVSESTRAYHFGRGKLQFPRKLSTMSKTSRATLHRVVIYVVLAETISQNYSENAKQTPQGGKGVGFQSKHSRHPLGQHTTMNTLGSTGLPHTPRHQIHSQRGFNHGCNPNRCLRRSMCFSNILSWPVLPQSASWASCESPSA